jgi:uncharacterized protein (DUF433 family)
VNAKEQIVHSDPEIMGGELVFVSTRVPLYNLFDYLEAGDSLGAFLEQFPSVSREQAAAALEMAFAAVVVQANPDVFEGEWAKEIERRARRLIAGESSGEPWEDVRARIERRLKRT